MQKDYALSANVEVNAAEVLASEVETAANVVARTVDVEAVVVVYAVDVEANVVERTADVEVLKEVARVNDVVTKANVVDTAFSVAACVVVVWYGGGAGPGGAAQHIGGPVYAGKPTAVCGGLDLGEVH